MTIFSVGAVSLCSPEEKSLFSCQLEDSKKSVSLCQSNTDHKQILYKFGTPEKVEITLPNEKSPKAKIFFEQFGPSSSQWMKGVVFTSGKVEYSLSTARGISAQLCVDCIKKPFSMTCDFEKGDSGNEFSDAYDLMEKLKFKKRCFKTTIRRTKTLNVSTTKKQKPLKVRGLSQFDAMFGCGDRI